MAPSDQATSANLSPPECAKRLDVASCDSARTWIAKWPLEEKASRDCALLASDQSTSGGSSETELKLLAVTPTGAPAISLVVTMVTPVGCCHLWMAPALQGVN